MALTLQGPIGTYMKEVGCADESICSDRGRKAHFDAIRAYERAGANVAVTGTYGLYRANDENGLYLPDNWQDAREQLFEHARVLVDATRGSTARQTNTVLHAVSFGSAGDANNPEHRGNADEGLAYDYFDRVAYNISQLNSVPWIALGEAFPTVAGARAAARAFSQRGVETLLSFNLDKDGRLQDGHSLGDAIRQVGEVAETGFGINCCPPKAVRKALDGCPEDLRGKVRAVYPNAIANPEDWDGSDGVAGPNDPEELAGHFRSLIDEFGIDIFGGCCGNNPSHIAIYAQHHLYKACPYLQNN